MSNAELFQAFQMFQNGVQDAATHNAVKDATDAMRQIKTGITDEAEQRRALQGLSDETALRLTGIGAPASAVQGAFQAIAPQQFGSVEQMQLEGQLGGSKLLQDTAGGIMKERVAAKRGEMQFANQLEMQRDSAKFQRDFALASMQANAKAKQSANVFGLEKVDPNIQLEDKEVKDLRAGMLKLQDVSSLTMQLDELVGEHGTDWMNMPFGNKISTKMDTAHGQLILRLKELENLGVLQKIDVDALEKVVPNPSNFINTSTYEAKMDQFKQGLASRVNNAAKQGGFRVSDKFANSLGLGRQLGAVPAGVGGNLDKESRLRIQIAREHAGSDPRAAAELEQYMKGLYGK